MTGKIYGNSGIVHFAETNQAPAYLLNVGAYWKSSNHKAYTKKLSQILASNIGNWGREAEELVSEVMWGIAGYAL